MIVMNDICARRDEMVNEGKLKKTEIQPQIIYFYLHEIPVDVKVININLAFGQINLHYQYRVLMKENTLKQF